MERRTVRAAHEGRCRVHVNSGGRGTWCSFDYVIRPAPSDAGVAVEIGDAPDAETLRWFPDVRRGISLGSQRLRDHYGIDLAGLLVTITKVHSHPIDTTPEGCERYGCLFIEGFGQDQSKCVPADREPQEHA